jgi:transposase
VRTRAISLARSITRAAGLRIRSGRTETFLARLAVLELSAAMKTTLAPLRSLIDLVDDELVNADEQFQALVAGDPTVKRLTTLTGIGPITASAFVAALDVASRFERTQSSRKLLGSRPSRVQLGRETATRARHAQRTSAPAVVTRASRLACVACFGSAH